MNQRSEALIHRKAAPDPGFVTVAVAVAPSGAVADGISVFGSGETMTQPNLVEIDLFVSGKAELTGDAEACGGWQRDLERRYRPQVRVYNLAGVDRVPPALLKGPAPGTGARAWICRGTQCLPPVDSPEALAAALAP